MLHRILSQKWQRMKVVVTPILQRHLLATNTLTCGALLAGGDCIQQRIEKVVGMQANHKHDTTRTGRMFLVGLSQGPPHHYWYIWLDKWLPKRDLRTVGLKILADQFLAAPFFAITFIYGMGLLEDKRMSECWDEFRSKFLTIYVFDWIIWPPSQFINFMFIPQAFRVLYVNIVTVIWDIFLSYIKHLEISDIEDQEAAEKTR